MLHILLSMSRKITGFHLLALAASGILLFCTALGKTSLWANDEPTYAEIAKEMMQSGNWLTPMFNHQVWFCHPPLYMWLTGFTFKFFGWNEITARIFPCIFAILGLFIVYQLASDFWNRETGFLSAVVLATTLQYLIQGRMATMDTMLNAFLLASFYSGWKALETGSDSRKKWWNFFFLSCAIATLAKGIFGLAYPLLIFGIYLLAKGEISRWKEIPWVRGLFLYFLIAAPWFLYETLRYGKDFFSQVFYFYTFKRVVSPILQQSGPIYYYLPVLFFGFFPWSGFLPALSVKAVSLRKDRKIFFLFLWALVTFIFFTLVNTKLPNYIFFLYPPLSMLLAYFWMQFRRREFFAATGLILLILALLAYGLRIVILQKVTWQAAGSHFPQMYFILGILAAGSILAFLLELAGKRKAAFYALALSVCIFWLTSMTKFSPVIEEYKPMKPLANELEKYLHLSPAPVVVYHVSGAVSLLFYDSLSFITLDRREDFLQHWRKEKIYGFLPDRELRRLELEMKPLRRLKHLQTIWLVSNFNPVNPKPARNSMKD